MVRHPATNVEATSDSHRTTAGGTRCSWRSESIKRHRFEYQHEKADDPGQTSELGDHA
jgi:hypothetical protein